MATNIILLPPLSHLGQLLLGPVPEGSAGGGQDDLF